MCGVKCEAYARWYQDVHLSLVCRGSMMCRGSMLGCSCSVTVLPDILSQAWSHMLIREEIKSTMVLLLNCPFNDTVPYPLCSLLGLLWPARSHGSITMWHTPCSPIQVPLRRAHAIHHACIWQCVHATFDICYMAVCPRDI